MVANRIRKTIGILLAILFIVTMTVSTVSALNPQPEPPSPINTVGLHSHFHVLAMNIKYRCSNNRSRNVKCTR